MIRSPAARWNHAKTTRLRDCSITNKISTFIPEARISESQKSSVISQDEVFADHGHPNQKSRLLKGILGASEHTHIATGKTDRHSPDHSGTDPRISGSGQQYERGQHLQDLSAPSRSVRLNRINPGHITFPAIPSDSVDPRAFSVPIADC